MARGRFLGATRPGVFAAPAVCHWQLGVGDPLSACASPPPFLPRGRFLGATRPRVWAVPAALLRFAQDRLRPG